MTPKTIIITGTSRGIGLELAQQFAAANHQIIALSRNTAPLQELALPTVTALSCDISDPNDVQQVKKYIENNGKKVDILINNAGKMVNRPFAELSFEEIESAYQTNILGVFMLMQAVLPYMDKNGHVVNITTMGGVQGSVKFPGLAAYSSSKAAVITLTEVLAEEYKESGPAFNALALGAVQTQMLEEAFPGYKAPVSASEMAGYIKDFALTGHRFYNGKLMQVANSTP